MPEAPAWLAKIPCPRAIYVGTIDSRLDIRRSDAARSGTPGPAGRPGRPRRRRSPHLAMRGAAEHPCARRGRPRRRRRSTAQLRGDIARAPPDAADGGDEPAEGVRVPRCGQAGAGDRPRPGSRFGSSRASRRACRDFIDLVDTALEMGTLPETERRRSSTTIRGRRATERFSRLPDDATVPVGSHDMKNTDEKVLLVCSGGGHLRQLHGFVERIGYPPERQLWVTFRNGLSESLLADREVVYAPFTGPRDLKNFVKLVSSPVGSSRTTGSPRRSAPDRAPRSHSCRAPHRAASPRITSRAQRVPTARR